jgi:hypothetical protein
MFDMLGAPTMKGGTTHLPVRVSLEKPAAIRSGSSTE